MGPAELGFPLKLADEAVGVEDEVEEVDVWVVFATVPLLGLGC
jgi:hypothetical protein